MNENKERIGFFTSSQIYKLVTFAKDGKSFGAPALNYIEERNIERKMNRSITLDAYSNSMAWGNFLEMYVFSQIGIEYTIKSTETTVHPKHKFWSGSTDLLVPGKKISDIKCYEPLKFSRYVDALVKKDPEFLKKEFPQEYWQLGSNADIHGVPNAEAICFMPYKSQIPELREMAEYYEGADQWKYRFIAERELSGLAWLHDGGYYKNLNIYEFEFPKADKDLLNEIVEKAGKLLIPFSVPA